MEPMTDPTEPTDHRDLLASDQPARHSRSRRGVVAALLTVALLAAGATGVALASTGGTATPTPGSSGSASASPEGGQQGPRGDHDGDGRRGPGLRGGFGGPGMFGLMGAVHGEVVVPKQGGGFETLLMQRGTATAVSAGSISVKSADGFTATYDVTKDTQVNAGSAGITSIDKNANVVVTARKTASGGTALRVLDLSQLGTFHRDFDGRRGPGGRGPGAPGGTSTPTPSASTGGTSFGV
jgi:hypothetical protein